MIRGVCSWSLQNLSKPSPVDGLDPSFPKRRRKRVSLLNVVTHLALGLCLRPSQTDTVLPDLALEVEHEGQDLVALFRYSGGVL